MKIGTLTATAAAGALTLVLPAALAPVAPNLFGGGVGLALTGAGMVACGMAFHRLRKAQPHEPGLTPALAPLPRFFAEERARSSGQVIPFGRKLVEHETPDLPPMLEAQLKRQLLRRAERICRSERD